MEGKTQIKFSIIMVFVGVIALAVGTSYAIFNTSKMSDKTQVIQSGTVNLLLTELSDGLDLSEATPMDDEEGKNQNTYYSFKVENKSDTSINYDIKLLDDENSDVVNRLDSKYVKVGLELNSSFVSVTGLTDSNRLIYTREGLTKTSTDEYKLRLWLADNQTDVDSYDGYSACFKLKIEATQSF